VHRGGKNFQDLVGSYLCSVGHKILNARTLAGCTPGGLSASALSSRLIEIADEVFSEDYDDCTPGSAHRAARLRLDRDKLVNSMPDRAAWVLAKNNPKKILGRRRGGAQGRAQGVRKGPVPRLVPGLIGDFWHLDPSERKSAFQHAHPCSDSTYYELQKKYRERAAAPRSGVLSPDDLDGLLPT
jgi:hypothetical protein